MKDKNQLGQRCANCNEPTGRWESGSLWIWFDGGFEGPFCPKCYDGQVCRICGRPVEFPNNDSQCTVDGYTKQGPFCEQCCDKHASHKCIECENCNEGLWTWQETSMGGYSYGPLCNRCYKND